MRTEFSPDQLADPEIATSAQAIRSCVHCGFCTATCPTFVLLGDELDSPRGRIYLIKDMLENGRDATPEGQVVMQARQERQRSMCLTVFSSAGRPASSMSLIR